MRQITLDDAIKGISTEPIYKVLKVRDNGLFSIVAGTERWGGVAAELEYREGMVTEAVTEQGIYTYDMLGGALKDGVQDGSYFSEGYPLVIHKAFAIGPLLEHAGYRPAAIILGERVWSSPEPPPTPLDLATFTVYVHTMAGFESEQRRLVVELVAKDGDINPHNLEAGREIARYLGDHVPSAVHSGVRKSL